MHFIGVRCSVNLQSQFLAIDWTRVVGEADMKISFFFFYYWGLEVLRPRHPSTFSSIFMTQCLSWDKVVSIVIIQVPERTVVYASVKWLDGVWSLQQSVTRAIFRPTDSEFQVITPYQESMWDLNRSNLIYAFHRKGLCAFCSPM